MDKEIHDLRETLANAKVNEKLLRANLIAVNATMSTEDLRASAITLESEKEGILARLSALKSGSSKPISTREKEEVERAWKEWTRKANLRKKMCMELWDLCTEGIQEGQTKEELWVKWSLSNSSNPC